MRARPTMTPKFQERLHRDKEAVDTINGMADEGERKGLMLCCMRTAERYGDSQRGKIAKGTKITCDKCGQEIESLGGQAWKAK